MTFEAALWNNSDPTYAPCLQWQGRNRDIAYWVAPRRYVKAGYAVHRVSIGKGDRDAPVPPLMATRCRELTRDMVRWYDGMEHPKVEVGTWHWLIARYQSDDISPYHGVKANTRRGYDQWLKLVDNVVGDLQIPDLTYETLVRIQRGKADKGRSAHHIHNWFNTLRRVARYGDLIGAPGADRVSSILSNMRIPSPPSRSVAPSREQIAMIVAAADAAGLKAFAAGILIQFWFSLRAVDVRGLTIKGQWQDGLTWDAIHPDFTGFTKVISKTAKSLPEPYAFDLTLVPDIRQRLIDLCDGADLEERSGPVTISEKTSRPYTESGWSQAWARCRDAAGLPKHIWMMDTRAGAGTDASQIEGVTPMMLRNTLQHMQSATSNRYVRERSRDANAVLRLRVASKST